MERLIVKNFGPLKDIDIKLNKINLFIGENGSGKSVLAKIITIITSLESDTSKLIKKFDEYNIGFIQKDTEINYYIDNKLYYNLKNKEAKSIVGRRKLDDLPKDYNSKSLDDMLNTLSNPIRKFITEQNSKYIPAERNLISLFNKSLTTLIIGEAPLPKFLLQFSSEFEKAGNKLKELQFLDVKYINGDGLDRHRVYFSDNSYLPLEFSSSGIQSALPLYLAVKYFAQKHKNIIIEEPEQNLFPKAQADTIKYIIEQVSNDNRVFMMTHSPYVLSTLNNLIYAYIVAKLGDKEKKKVKKLINEKEWINPNDFSAYYLENGEARSIKSDIGLINDNEIDDISEDMGEEFDELLEVYRVSKND